MSSRAGRWILLALTAIGVIAAGGVPLAQEDEFTAKRNAMVAALVADGIISDQRVIEAMRTVPRHLFVSEAQRSAAYRDQALPIGYGQNLYAPSIIGIVVEAAAPQATDRVLELGTGVGYQAAILARLARHVYSIEPIAELAARARQNLTGLGVTNVTVKQGDPYLGWPEQGPFNVIVVNAAVQELPTALTDQLAEGGRLVVPLADEGWAQKLYLFTKRNGQLERTELADVIFAPLVHPE